MTHRFVLALPLLAKQQPMGCLLKAGDISILQHPGSITEDDMLYIATHAEGTLKLVLGSAGWG
jgi:hypothetical protein